MEVDQTPIGKTPQSCPATYIGFWDLIRKLYAQTDDTLIHGWSAGRIDMGHEGGDAGGEVVVEGMPVKLLKAWKQSETGKALREFLK